MKKVVVLSIAVLVFVVVLGFVKWDKQAQQNEIKAAEFQAEMEEQKKKEFDSFSTLYQGLLNGDVTKIKLIGDSITAGVGAKGHVIPDDNPVLFKSEGETYREADYEANSWANLFRNYTNRHFPDVEFINAGIGGKSTVFANANKEKWVSDKEDVVFVMLGTNDRWESSSIKEYKSSLEQFLKFVDSKSNLMIVMSPPPALTDGTNDRFNFGMKDVDKAVKEVTKKNKYTFISNYDAIMSYSEDHDLELKELLQDTSSHPEDPGYKVIWEHIKKDLTLKNSGYFN
ncbi:SGNH/GDSL hydrolase family protein [Lederbergia galactosidilytica]|uniref:SGNH hydrolase-type esterase domain-containing protein n=1 Tax=Lederbergia galactosidilytica TaxID=217031 RepID=A0A177ZYC9_9BACI|nr:SGNH/GDSL hydrolase family protein [Lederbergia galactosidilytica]OAK72693.1 hypothetical protein ABB05_07500 [Lederbergia galactosidilytica]